MRVDLHIHSRTSDGCWSPEEIVCKVREKGIEFFALTDHDSVAGIAAAQAAARRYGLYFLAGVEISTCLNGVSFHILGYNIDPEHKSLRALLAENAARLEVVLDGDISCLIERGVALDFKDYQGYSYDRARGGFKSLNYLVDRGFCTGFTDWLVKFGKHIPRDWSAFPHPAAAVAQIRQAGGIAIVAHPGGSLRGCGGLSDETLQPLLDCGISGLEAYSCYHTGDMTAFCAAWCRRHNLCITGGSDCHGPVVERELGVPQVYLSDLELGELRIV